MAERPDFYDLIAQNRRRTWMLMFAFFVLLVLVGIAVSVIVGGGLIGVVLAVVVSFGITFSSYYSSASIALNATRARPAAREDFGRLHNLVEEVSIAAGVPKPGVYVVHDPSPNAFATGRNADNAAVAVTTGLMDKMNRAELEGVIAHEVAHIRNGDILVMTVAVATAGAIAMISDIFFRMLYWGALTGGGASHRRRSNNNNGGGAEALIAIAAIVFVAILAPLAAALLKAAVSRSRESLADATAVEITRYPGGLRSALEKLDADITVVKRTSHATSHLWIESPDDHEADDRGRRFNDRFSTHPPLAERINILREMEGLPPYEGPDPTVSEALRTMQDDRNHPESVAAAVPTPGRTALFEGAAARSVDLGAIFAGAGEVADEDDDPDHAKAGWYADPSGTPATLRYWNGRDWTEHVHQIPGGNDLQDPDARPASGRNRGRRARGGGGRSYQ
ncbi:MAG: M48 family metalloprotease [Actinomycetota bacterium]